MARARRDWESLRGDIYRHLREDETRTYYEPAHLLMLFNESKDLREMQIQEKHEGFSTEVHTADLVADQATYSLLEYAGRLKKVSRVYPSLNREIPLMRDERISRPLSTTTVGKFAIPSYRLIGNLIKLEPTPGEAVTAGLKIEMEIASDRLASDGDKLPIDWPLFMETLLVYDTVIGAIEDEESLDTDTTYLKGMQRRRAVYENRFDEWVTSRSFGRVLNVRYTQGA